MLLLPAPLDTSLYGAAPASHSGVSPPLPPHRTPDGQADLLRRLAFALYVGEHNQYVGALQVLLPPPGVGEHNQYVGALPRVPLSLSL